MSDTTPIRDVAGLTEAMAETRAELHAVQAAGAGEQPGGEPTAGEQPGSGGAETQAPVQTLPELEALPAKQRFALEDLMAGSSYTEAAYNAGVDRKTLYRWVNHDPAFRCAMDAWRQRAISSAEDQLTQATEAAVATLRIAATRDYRAAAVLLKGRGLLSGPGVGRPRKMPAEMRDLPIPAGRMGDFEVRLRELILSFRDEARTPGEASVVSTAENL